ncbi:DUF4102 domain-containing protein [Budviciaceae bacterium BWR-B9]|uniref:DUF4102 domain-containing protein n=1 Tax=Limnobaculum allomyrinae TaxID=2791986 RepID=A0ABS1ITH3_9GAMM|nr:MULTISPECIES: Arm DNA-binding domain-containing protein [Limnobaculum]MBK5144837.1 DUF4102 domain-containing protein [Limnobaculum allomyrinae]MBV7692500.1 Arm DNA-binding domain-containing protein [Limnobaculum sp. M2-1]
MPLTDIAIRSAKPTHKPYKLSDSLGLYLLIKPNGSKLWYLKYRIDAKERKLAFGGYPTITLSHARSQRELARLTLSQGLDPSLQKQREKQSRKNDHTFESVARKWVKNQHKWSTNRSARTLRTLEMYLFQKAAGVWMTAG